MIMFRVLALVVKVPKVLATATPDDSC